MRRPPRKRGRPPPAPFPDPFPSSYGSVKKTGRVTTNPKPIWGGDTSPRGELPRPSTAGAISPTPPDTRRPNIAARSHGRRVHAHARPARNRPAPAALSGDTTRRARGRALPAGAPRRLVATGRHPGRPGHRRPFPQRHPWRPARRPGLPALARSPLNQVPSADGRRRPGARGGSLAGGPRSGSMDTSPGPQPHRPAGSRHNAPAQSQNKLPRRLSAETLTRASAPHAPRAG